MSLTYNQHQLVYWINERESIRKKKEAGLPVPWSDNLVMQDTYFCNVNREDDKVTKWIRQNWTYDKQTYCDFAMVVARLFNLPSTLDAIGKPSGNLNRWISNATNVLAKRKAEGYHIWGGAYMITTAGKKIDKLTYCMELLSKIINDRNIQITKGCHTLKEAHTRLMKIDGLASFLSAQVVADLKNIEGHPLTHAEDWFTFSAHGPGSLRGLEWFWEEKVTAKNYQRKIAEASVELWFETSDATIHNMCMQNFQNCLCEYDKFMRVTNKTGRSKRKYNGRG